MTLVHDAQRACEATNRSGGQDFCRQWIGVVWRERYRCYLCPMHYREYERRAAKVADGTAGVLWE